MQTLKYSLLVFLGGASYGVMASTVKFSYAAGFSWTHTVSSQGIFGCFLFLVTFGVVTLFGKRPEKMRPKQVVRLMLVGIFGCSTSILYGFSLTMLPVAVAITLLFQFTWIGIVIQVITTRRKPHLAEIIAALIIFGGTLLAGGLLSGSELSDLDPLGLLCAFLSAITYATFMFLTSKIETEVPYLQRGLLISFGNALVSLSLSPDFFTSGIILEGIWKYGLVLGFFGSFIPVILFGIATPHLPTGISTIMASSELPAAIVISVFLLGEPIDLFQTLGIVVILAGVVVSQMPYIQLARTLKARQRSG